MPKTDHRIELTDRKVAALKPAVKGARYQVMDTLVPGFGVRVTETGSRTYILRTRYPGQATPSRRELKGTNEDAREHVVPVTNDIYAILKSLPAFRSGECLFSTTSGKTSVWVSSKVKARLDARMLLTLKAIARIRKQNSRAVVLRPWVNHDLRRTLRTGLSKLRVDRDVREAVIGHALPGIEGVYDRYDYLDEKRDALERWATYVWSIVEPTETNVVHIRAVA